MECICGNKILEIKTEDDSLFIEGKEYSYTTEFYYCSKCGKEWLSPEQLDKQCSQITEIKRHAAGFLTPREIAELRERHGITQEQAAIIFGGGRNAFSKYERGESYPSRAMDNLMRLFDKIPEVRRALYEKAGIEVFDVENVENIEFEAMNIHIEKPSKLTKIIPFPSSKNKNLKLKLQM